MFKRNCVVKYVDSFGVEHAAKVEAESQIPARSIRLTSFVEIPGEMVIISPCTINLEISLSPVISHLGFCRAHAGIDRKHLSPEGGRRPPGTDLN
jgi:hypothetical protein